jgi:hypothetical protein
LFLSSVPSALATQLIEQAYVRYGIKPGELTLHQDRGSPMIAHGYLDVMKELSGPFYQRRSCKPVPIGDGEIKK